MGMAPVQTMPIIQQLAAKNGSKVREKSLQLGGRDPAKGIFVPLNNGKVTIQLQSGAVDMASTSQDYPDAVSVNFTPVPGEEKIAAIYRRSPYKAGARPIDDNVASDLLAKYGKPTYEESGKHSAQDFFVWAFDSNGTPLKSWAGKKCLLQFPKPDGRTSDPTSTNNSWSWIIESQWEDKQVSSYYKSCGTKLLIIESMIDSQIRTVNQISFIFYDIQAVIDGQKKANELMAAVSRNVTKDVIKGANQVKPSL
ncbi:MAG: hypothetical protein BWK72_19070 [Rhodoferax ferrireducens]|uniref:Uncharacterized protein n=1 Tax=Rhodoferax ferrireducens TaxID=192843 RepID=A0A1W9KPC0_9BURK|nr:MAG: hypothetical protein BWK72_19070 [Rhodoferax ferrireducens]